MSNADRKIGQIDTKLLKMDRNWTGKFQIGLAWKIESFLEHFLNRYFGQVVVTQKKTHIFAENMLQMQSQLWIKSGEIISANHLF